MLDFTGNNEYEIRQLARLSYPVSNILLPISSFLIRRAEKSKLLISNIEKTNASGILNVQFKTTVPNILSLVLNRFFYCSCNGYREHFTLQTIR